MSASSAVPFRIFICYRREVDEGFAGRLKDHLVPAFAERNVLIDDTITAGAQWMAALKRRVTDCDVMLVVIGPRWAKLTDKKGYLRLWNEDDWVAFEIESAFTAKKHIIPVLVGGAKRPKAKDLPDALGALLDRQTFEVRSSRFKSDVEVLVEQLLGLQRRKRARAATSQPGGHGGSLLPDTSRTATPLQQSKPLISRSAVAADEAMRLNPALSVLNFQFRDRRRARDFTAPTTFDALSSAVLHFGVPYRDLEWGFLVTPSLTRGGRISGTRAPVRVWAQTRLGKPR